MKQIINEIKQKINEYTKECVQLYKDGKCELILKFSSHSSYIADFWLYLKETNELLLSGSFAKDFICFFDYNGFTPVLTIKDTQGFISLMKEQFKQEMNDLIKKQQEKINENL